jgi:hypothetical protein
MDALIVIFAAILALVGLDFAAFAWGADSRPGVMDDHRR